MARVLIRKRPDGLLNVYVKPSRPGERQAERSSNVTPAELERCVADKLDRIKTHQPIVLPGT